MKKSAKNNFLNEKLTSLIQTKPQTFESDDDDFITVDKLNNRENESDYSAEELEVPKLRKLNSSLLEEDDRYLGKGISRKDLIDSDLEGDETDEDELSVTKSNAEESVDSDFVNDSEEEENETVDNDSEKAEGEDQADSDLEEPLAKRAKQDVENSNYKKNDGVDINKELISKAARDIEKGRAIKTQLLLWDFLLNCRMKFQACLLASNQFPSYRNFSKFKGNSEFDELVLKTKKTLKHLLKSFLSLQEILLSKNEEFISSVKYEKFDTDSKNSKDDNEINSDLENEIDSENNESFKLNFCCQLKNLKDFAQEIDKRHKSFQNYRNNTIQKWDDKTRLGCISNKNFSAFEQSVLKEIEHILMDRKRLITRTQIKRTNYPIIGGGDNEELPSTKQAQTDENSHQNIQSKNIICKEIFDDDDFYHQLLSELIKRKASDVTDPVQLGRQWMQLQKARSKMKKNVDTKASKARKVRFVVHPKLVNFMMPTSLMENENARNELINSLFGKKN